jgi:hypothetical protein
MYNQQQEVFVIYFIAWVGLSVLLNISQIFVYEECTTLTIFFQVSIVTHELLSASKTFL